MADQSRPEKDSRRDRPTTPALRWTEPTSQMGLRERGCPAALAPIFRCFPSHRPLACAFGLRWLQGDPTVTRTSAGLPFWTDTCGCALLVVRARRWVAARAATRSRRLQRVTASSSAQRACHPCGCARRRQRDRRDARACGDRIWSPSDCRQQSQDTACSGRCRATGGVPGSNGK